MRYAKQAIATVLLISSGAGHAQLDAYTAKVGDVFEIRKEYKTSQSSDDESSSNSSGHTNIIERVVEVRADGVVLEYNLPKATKPNDRLRQWQLPVRVLKPATGPLKLLNAPELDLRLTDWLKRAKMKRAACGRWIFTWDAFLIECDPESAIGIITQYDMGTDRLAHGAYYEDARASKPGILTKSNASAAGTQFTASLEVDAEKVRFEMAKSEMVVAEILRKPVTREQAIISQSKKDISGTLFVTLDVLASGQLWRRTTVTNLSIVDGAESSEKRTETEIIERRRIDEPAMPAVIE